MPEEEDQMGLFEPAGAAPQQAPREVPAPPTPAPPLAKKTRPATAPPAQKKSRPAPPAPAPAQPARRKSVPPAAAAAPVRGKVSGLVPQGDVRLTANIRQDLHLKLKLASAYRRTTIGEIIEELIAAHL